MEQKVYQLSEICEIKSGKRIPKDMRFVEVPTLHPYIRARDIKDGKISVDSLIYLEDNVYEKIKKYIICSDDIAITIVGASVGDIAYAKANVNGYNLTENAVRLTNFNNKVHSKYLFYMLYQKQYKDYMQLIAGAAAQPKLGIYKIQKIKVKLPNFTEQKSIASVLSAYDDLIEKNNRKIEILQDMAEELYKEWFVRFRFPGHETAKFENGIPKDWDIDKLKNKVNRLPFNRLYKEADLEKEGKVIVIDQSEKEFLGFHNNEPSHVASIDEPICLFGDHSCKFKLISEPFSLGENVVPFKGKGINSYYLFYATHKIIETEEYKRHWGLFVSKKILIPPEPLQNSFADFIKTIHKQVDKITKCQRLLIKQRDLLLPRLMSGKHAVKVS